MANKYYVAYGSNLNMEQMEGAKVVGTSVLKGYRLLFKGSLTGSYLTVEPEEGCSVPVGIWEVTPAHERSLDRYEGVFYYKKELTLPVKDLLTGEMREMDAFAYIMYEDRKIGVPARYYVDTCLDGYRDFGLDEAVLKEAVDYSRRHTE